MREPPGRSTGWRRWGGRVRQNGIDVKHHRIDVKVDDIDMNHHLVDVKPRNADVEADVIDVDLNDDDCKVDTADAQTNNTDMNLHTGRVNRSIADVKSHINVVLLPLVSEEDASTHAKRTVLEIEHPEQRTTPTRARSE